MTYKTFRFLVCGSSHIITGCNPLAFMHYVRYMRGPSPASNYSFFWGFYLAIRANVGIIRYVITLGYQFTQGTIWASITTYLLDVIFVWEAC